MNISEQTDFALNHRAFKQALENYSVGYTDDLRYILIILQKEAANKTKESQNKCYQAWCRLNIADIKHELKINEIPATMDCKMPIVAKAEPVVKKTVRLKLVIQSQYQLFEQVA